MRKFAAITISMLICIFLCSCGKSDAAKRVDNLILKIGTVTLESEEAINTADEAVKALSSEDYEQLDNLSTLDAAKESLQLLRYQEQAQEIDSAIEKIGSVTLYSSRDIKQIRYQIDTAGENIKKHIKNLPAFEEAEKQLQTLRVNNVIDLIDNIGTVTLDSLNDIAKANIAYGGLSDEEKLLVKNYHLVTEAFEQHSKLKIQAAIDAIDAIGEVTLDSFEKIKAAKDAISDLSYDEKKEVHNTAILKNASAAFDELKEEEEKRAKQELTSNMKTQTDKVNGITWYLPYEYPDYIDERCFLLPYIGQSDYSTFLRVKVNYTGNRWVFFDNLIISIDGENHYKNFNYYDVKRDNDTEVWENVDFVPDTGDIQILRDIINSDETIVRFQGDDRCHDFTISESDKSAIEYVLSIYNKLR